MEWILLLADVILVGILVRLWSNYQIRANDLKRRQQAAVQRVAEYRQQIEAVGKEIETVKAKMGQTEALSASLKGEVARAEEHLARLELSAGEKA